jgi:hypothetical protein
MLLKTSFVILAFSFLNYGISQTDVNLTLRGSINSGKYEQLILSSYSSATGNPTWHEVLAMAWTCNGIGYPTCTYRTLIKYNLSEIPKNSVIKSAKLKLFAKTSGQGNGIIGQPMYGNENKSLLQKVISAWNNPNTGWSNAPMVDVTAQKIIPQSLSSNQDYEANITDFVKAWVANPDSNFGMALKLETENYYNSQIFFGGTDDVPLLKRPTLEITYEIDSINFIDPIRFISQGFEHNVTLKTDGSIWVWGSNSYGQLGTGSTDAKLSPIMVGSNKDWKFFDAGWYHTVAIKNDGSLWAWGKNGEGQLGDGTNNQSNLPKRIGTSNDWKLVSAGGFHTLAIKNDGSIWSWGYNSDGQLGQGNSGNWNSTPTRIGTSNDWKLISTGRFHSMAIKNDGSLWAFGYNAFGQLGIGNYNNITVPTRVGLANNWIGIEAGQYHTLAIKNDSTLWSTGDNQYGQLGINSTLNKNSFVSINSETPWLFISAGGGHSMGIKRDKSLWTWGANAIGPLGDGTFTNKYVPIKIGTSNDWYMTGGLFSSIGLKTNLDVWTWSYYLGNGTTDISNIPVDIKFNLGTQPCKISNYNPLPDSLEITTATYELDAGAGYKKYNWNTGDTSRKIKVENSGWYKTTVIDDNGCIGTDSTYIRFINKFYLFYKSGDTASCNNPIQVSIRAKDFYKIITMQGTIKWDPTALRFDSVRDNRNDNLQLESGNFGITQTTNGKLSFSWNTIDFINGQTLPDSAILFTISFFPLKENAYQTILSFDNSPTMLEVYGINFIKREVVGISGTLNISCRFYITGSIKSPAGKPVKGVKIKLSGTGSYETQVNDDGKYEFNNIPAGTYTIKPFKNNEVNVTNGVSTIDLAYIQAHILGTLPFNNPYKSIASDANKNAFITALDIIHFRRLLLGMESTLPGGQTWTFADADHNFSGGIFPYPDSFNLPPSGGNIAKDFIAIKLGDVNFDRNPNLLTQSQPLELTYDTLMETNSQNTIIRIKSAKNQSLLGFQGTFSWDNQSFSLNSIEKNPLGILLSNKTIANGSLAFSWNDALAKGVNLSANQVLLELKGEFHKPYSSFTLHLGDTPLKPEAFGNGYKMMSISLKKDNNPERNFLVIHPNPTYGDFRIEFYSLTEGPSVLQMIDVEGRMINSTIVNTIKGKNQVEIKTSAVKKSGTYIVKLTTGNTFLTQKLVIIK